MKTFVFGCITVFLLSVSGFAADSTASTISLRTFLKQDAVPMNKEVVYVVELSWDGDLQRYHIKEMTEPVLTNLALRGSGSSNRFGTDEAGNPQSVKQLTYYLTPIEMGMGYVDGIVVTYEDMETGQSASLTAQRLGVKITEATEEAGSGVSVGKLILLGIAGLFLLIVAWFVWRYFKVRQEEQQDEEIVESASDRAKRELSELLRQSGADPQVQFGELDYLFRHYLSERLNLATSADYKTLIELWPNDQLDEDLKQKIARFYEQSELSKFAGEPITEAQFHLFADTVELVINHLESSSDKGE